MTVLTEPVRFQRMPQGPGLGRHKLRDQAEAVVAPGAPIPVDQLLSPSRSATLLRQDYEQKPVEIRPVVRRGRFLLLLRHFLWLPFTLLGLALRGRLDPESCALAFRRTASKTGGLNIQAARHLAMQRGLLPEEFCRVLAEILGMDSEQIDRLRAAGAIS